MESSLGTAPPEYFVCCTPSSLGTCSGTRDLAKRHLGAKQNSFRLKELESLLSWKKGKGCKKQSFIWGERVARLFFYFKQQHHDPFHVHVSLLLSKLKLSPLCSGLQHQKDHRTVFFDVKFFCWCRLWSGNTTWLMWKDSICLFSHVH